MPDDFTIQGATTSGRTGIRVQLNITHPNDPDLTATLVYHLGQADEKRVILFSGVGNGPNTANFNNTVFDDSADARRSSRRARPFFGTFNPQESLLTAFRACGRQGGLDPAAPGHRRQQPAPARSTAGR